MSGRYVPYTPQACTDSISERSSFVWKFCEQPHSTCNSTAPNSVRDACHKYVRFLSVAHAPRTRARSSSAGTRRHTHPVCLNAALDGDRFLECNDWFYYLPLRSGALSVSRARRLACKQLSANHSIDRTVALYPQ